MYDAYIPLLLDGGFLRKKQTTRPALSAHRTTPTLPTTAPNTGIFKPNIFPESLSKGNQ